MKHAKSRRPHVDRVTEESRRENAVHSLPPSVTTLTEDLPRPCDIGIIVHIPLGHQKLLYFLLKEFNGNQG